MNAGAGRTAGLGAVVLCGGKSRRMGRSKAFLPFGDECLLARTVKTISYVAWPICVVAAPGQELPELPPGVLLARDEAEGRGPLQGIAAGLGAISSLVSCAFVSSTDVPFLHPALIRRLYALQSNGYDIAVIRAQGHYHPLAAVYGCHVRYEAESLLREDRLRPFFLFERVRTLVADEALLFEDPVLREADPHLRSLRNLNTPEDYEAALREAGELTGEHLEP